METHTEEMLRTCIVTHSQKDMLHARGDKLLKDFGLGQSRYTTEETDNWGRPKLEQAHPRRGYSLCRNHARGSDTDKPSAAENIH